jgi:hypothetical protein
MDKEKMAFMHNCVLLSHKELYHLQKKKSMELEIKISELNPTQERQISHIFSHWWK